MFGLNVICSHSSLLDVLLLAQQAMEAAPAAPAETPLNLGRKFAFIAGVLLLAYVLGTFLSKALKMKEASGRITTVMLVLILGLSPFVYRLMEGGRIQDSFKWGIDLAGGTNLVYEVDHEKANNRAVNDEVMDQMVAAIIRRVNPSGTEEVTVRKVGADRIEIIIPGADQDVVDSKKKMISRLGSLEFGILANFQDDKSLIDNALRLPPDQDFYRVGDQVRAAWRDPGKTADGKTFKDVGEFGQVATREVTRNGQTYKQFLVVVEEPDRRITGENLSGVMPTSNPTDGSPAVSFQLDAKGARNMSQLTGRRKPTAGGAFQRRLAIILDDTVHQAPNINEPLSASVMVSGLDSREEVRELVNVLNAGALKVPIKPNPISEFSISPLLGADVQQKGLLAIGLSAATVFGFMLVYYLRAGVVACSCLLFNLVLVAAAMSVFNATITLPGLAGLVLTIGMAVDANVLIFERIREERDRGSSSRMSIQNGFAKALSTIVDSNVTTLITAAILFHVGSDQVRGFAVTLFIGILMSMFSAIYFGRLLFDIAERLKWLGSLRMFSVVGRTNIDFLGKRKAFAMLSIVLIIGGLAAFASRGQDNLDIDFTGGTMVTFTLDESSTVDQVQEILEKKFGPVTLESLAIGDSGPDAFSGKIFRMRTRLRDTEETGNRGEGSIRHMVGEAFDGQPVQPRRVTLEFGELADIPVSEPPAEEDPLSEETPAETKPPVSPFEGGHKVKLTFSDEISTAVALADLSAALTEILTGDQPKYGNPETLLDVQGTAGSGVEAGERAVKLFSEMDVQVSPTVAEADLLAVLKQVQTQMAENPTFDEVNSFDSAVAVEMQQDAVLAILFSMVAIVFYIWIRFDKVTFGLAAVAALVHDVLAMLGMLAIGSYLAETPIGPILGLTDFKINLPMVAAFLTLVGYSLNDTIVVFDRIRENRGKNPALTVSMVNNSLNQTLSRTLLTSFTTWIVVAILYVWGGEGIHGFAYCLMLGVVIGTYSSIYIASPILLWLINRPGSEIGIASAKMEAEEAARAQRQTAGASA